MQKDDAAGFAAKYGTRSNAFGNCVSAQAQQQGGSGQREQPPAS